MNLMRPKDVMRELGLAPTTFYKLQRRGLLRRFEVKAPMGTRRYSGELVKKLAAGESVTTLGGRR